MYKSIKLFRVYRWDYIAETFMFNKTAIVTRAITEFVVRKRGDGFDDAEMQFVARQEVIAPRALPVSTSRYLQRLALVRSCFCETINYLVAPRPRQFLLLARKKEKEKKRNDRNEGEEVRDKSIRDRYRSSLWRDLESVKSRLRFWRETCVNETHYLIDA